MLIYLIRIFEELLVEVKTNMKVGIEKFRLRFVEFTLDEAR